MEDSVAVRLRDESKVGLPPSRLWPVLSNTNRFNKSIGWPAVQLDPHGSASDFSMRVSADLGLFSLEWQELPFEWIEGRYFTLTRIFSSGPLQRFEARVELEPEGADSSKLVIEGAFHARGELWAWLLERLVGRKTLRDLRGLARRVEQAAKGELTDVFPMRRVATPTNPDALARGLSRLAEAPLHGGARERLALLLADGFDDELFGLRPFESADRWGLPRLEVLKVFLHAVKAGLFDLSWEVLCPNCSAPKQAVSSLGGLKSGSHCGSCKIDYSANLDENVELRFNVNPSVRAAKLAVFCAGSPAHTPFAAAQLRLEPGRERSVELALASESYALRALSSKCAVRLRPSADGATRLKIDWRRPGELLFKPGAVQLDFPEPGGAPELARLEREAWKDRAAKASLVATFHEFRDLFSTEVLSPGVEISVRNLAVLFSDLKDSTALYEKIGDATAYAVVRDHFDFLFDIIARHGGGVVKTIGDAVMAAFPTGAQALAAALDMQEEVGRLNDKLKPRPPVRLKLGVHQGPCIAINAGGALDYFGTTINVAARVQNESHGGDVVLTEAVLGDSKASGLLTSRPWRTDEFQLQLKGLSRPFRLLRLSPR
ncbi:MAG: hypothetical protein HY553_00720 [Elusimicrobia bacterium]|nr:hypothetical protein [Elusimicrobiota bacterium]